MSVVIKPNKEIIKPKKKGLKSLYYCRSKSIQRAENINSGASTDVEMNVYMNKDKQDEEYEECFSCQ